jgi:NTP pyrophosphatase (non-canonical NTP hydrolase)
MRGQKRSRSRPRSASRSERRARTSKPARQKRITKRSRATEVGTNEFEAIKAGFKAFQDLAKQTNHFETGGPQGAIAPMFGLASETGSILDAHKRYLRDGHDFQTNQEVLRDELGDLIWYISAVATAAQLDLGEIASQNVKRSRDLYPPCKADRVSELFPSLPNFEANFPDVERFPRRLVVEFKEDVDEHRRAIARLTLVDAVPNHFPQGQVTGPDKKKVGFTLNRQLGAKLNDNTRRVDGYRYHDAIHLGFMAVLGWSPTTRELLRLKRKSSVEADTNMDGARAIYAEEGLVAVLSRLAPRRMRFLEERTVDGTVIEITKAATTDLEVEVLPAWIWRRAISQGFIAMTRLTENRGGYLTADLDARELRYSKVRG